MIAFRAARFTVGPAMSLGDLRDPQAVEKAWAGLPV
jgi:hypothetical protein